MAQALSDKSSYATTKADISEQAGETKDLETDPTLQRSPIQCPQCFKSGAVFYQDQAKRHTTNMTLFYYCIHCKHMFRDEKAIAKSSY